MKNRRGFLTVLTAASGAALSAAMSAKGEGAGAAAPSSPPPVPAAKSGKAPSAAALAIAATYRAFDPKLSGDELRAIAASIDDNRAGQQLNPKKKPLRNSDEPVVRFAADETLHG